MNNVQKRYRLVTAHGSVLAVCRMTADELKHAVRRDRHEGRWEPVTETKRSLLSRILVAV